VKRNVLFLLAITIIIFPLLQVPTVFALEESKVIETNCCKIQYQYSELLRNFTLRIGGFKYTSKGLDDNPANVKTRVDGIMKKVQSILDMYPEDLRISIVLYPEHNSLSNMFRQFSKAGNIPIAFYSHKSKSIYVDVSSVTDGVLGHEMAHAVINFYFVTPPPAKMQEILAQFVDLHLWD
jgi:hypothetical protein